MDKKIRIAVSGVGGGVGQSIIKALDNTDYEVIAFDGEVLATGLYAVSKAYIIPYASDPSFVERVIELCQKERCQLFFPGLDAELPVLSQAADRFKQAGIQLIVSRPEVVALSDDKLLTYTSLMQHDILVPKTIGMSDYMQGQVDLPGYPFVLKKRIGGARSQDVYIVENQEKLESLTATGLDFNSFVAQEYIEGEEYTCGSVNLDGECQGIIVMRRILRDGDTYKCFTIRDGVIEAQVRKAMEAIKPFGACNVQLRVKDGQPYIFEINARCSGTTAARALCGFNEPKMIADYLCWQKKPSYTIKEQAVLRYWKELVVANEAIDSLKQNGEIQSDKPVQL